MKLEIMRDDTTRAAMRAKARTAFEAWYRKTSPMHIVPAAVGRMLGMTTRKSEKLAPSSSQ
jgi:hypothetical protein